MADHHEDDLAASKTEGFKVGEKKTIEEYTQLGMSCIQCPLISNAMQWIAPVIPCLVHTVTAVSILKQHTLKQSDH